MDKIEIKSEELVEHNIEIKTEQSVENNLINEKLESEIREIINTLKEDLENESKLNEIYVFGFQDSSRNYGKFLQALVPPHLTTLCYAPLPGLCTYPKSKSIFDILFPSEPSPYVKIVFSSKSESLDYSHISTKFFESRMFQAIIKYKWYTFAQVPMVYVAKNPPNQPSAASDQSNQTSATPNANQSFATFDQAIKNVWSWILGDYASIQPWEKMERFKQEELKRKLKQEKIKKFENEQVEARKGKKFKNEQDKLTQKLKPE
ncbi:4211_t:CDS:2, partial [Racocetra fulgida]